jgi:hypothetical protein
MSELGNLIKNLRGKKSQATIASGAGLNSRTLVRAENGQDVALSTVRALRKYFKLSDADYSELLKAWVNLQLGEDRKFVHVESRHGEKATAVAVSAAQKRFIEQLRDLPTKYQEQLTMALERREVLKSLIPLNDLYDKLKKV